MKNLMIFVYISNECNRECPNCYRSNSGGLMSKEIAINSASWISSICEEENVSELETVFLGGEPFLNIDTVFYFVDSLTNLLPKNVKSYKDGGLVLFTNGDFLTDEILKECKKRKIYLFLNPTYDTLDVFEQKINKIKSICHGVTFALVLDELNMSRLEDITKLAIKYHCNIRINRLYDGGNNLNYVQEYKRQMCKALDLLMEFNPPIWPNWIMESTYPTWNGPKNCYSCGKWLAVIDPDGSLRSCNPDLDTKIGHIDTHKHWGDLKMCQRWSAKNIPECQECQWVTWCQGGCPYTRKLTYGTYDHKSPFCEAFKELFPKLMLLTEKWKKYYGME